MITQQVMEQLCVDMAITRLDISVDQAALAWLRRHPIMPVPRIGTGMMELVRTAAKAEGLAGDYIRLVVPTLVGPETAKVETTNPFLESRTHPVWLSRGNNGSELGSPRREKACPSPTARLAHRSLHRLPTARCGL